MTSGFPLWHRSFLRLTSDFLCLICSQLKLQQTCWEAKPSSQYSLTIAYHTKDISQYILPLEHMYLCLLMSNFHVNFSHWWLMYLAYDKSTLVQVMAWCRQATSHYLSQFWPRSLLSYGVIRPQWVKHRWHSIFSFGKGINRTLESSAQYRVSGLHVS